MPLKNGKKKRDTVKYPGLEKKVNTKVRQEYLDQDYVNKLNDKEKEFLSNFNEEYYGGNFKHKGKKLHRNKESRRKCYNRNNSQNRCGFGTAKAKGGLIYNNPINDLDSLEENNLIYVGNPDKVEEALVEYLDDKNKQTDEEK